jgi:hypothetical protein
VSRAPKKSEVVIGGMGRAFFGPMDAKPEDIQEWPGMLEGIRSMGVWAFCETRAKPCPVVHYWASPDADKAHVAYVLGHEVGHISGRPLRSRRNAWAEELRADEYGAAAYLAMRHVLGRKP